MLTRSTVSIPNVSPQGRRPFMFGRSDKVEADQIQQDITNIIEGIASGSLNERQHTLLRSYIYAHYHPKLKIKTRVQIYQAVKSALEDANLNQLGDIVGIRKKSAYINTISNVGKRSSYFGGLIGVTVVGYFFLPPIVKLGILPVARRTVRKFAPKRSYLIPIDKSLKLSSLVGKSPDKIYKGIRNALGSAVGKAGKTVSSKIDTSPMDDMTGNLFFRALIEDSSFDDATKADLRARSQIALLCDMAKVSRQLEGLARDPGHSWDRISNYTNFAMFLKSMESKEVPIQNMLQVAVEIISRSQIGKKKKDTRFYTEFERGLKHLNYAIQVVEPLDRFNEQDDFDDIDSQQAKLAFFEQNRLVMERLYMGHDFELAKVRPMFEEFESVALQQPPKSAKTEEEKYEFFQKSIKKVLTSYRNAFRDLGQAELKSYDQELTWLRK